MSEERQDKIARYGEAPEMLASALPGFPKEMWQYRPSPDQWTIHEILIHLADSEVSSYFRCRRLIAEPGSGVPGYDEVRWAQALDYHGQDPEQAVELFGRLRRLSHRLIQGLPESVWSNAVEHSESGRMTMDDWLETYARHVPDHIQQMRTNLAAWRNSSASG